VLGLELRALVIGLLALPSLVNDYSWGVFNLLLSVKISAFKLSLIRKPHWNGGRNGGRCYLLTL